MSLPLRRWVCGCPESSSVRWLLSESMRAAPILFWNGWAARSVTSGSWCSRGVGRRNPLTGPPLDGGVGLACRGLAGTVRAVASYGNRRAGNSAGGSAGGAGSLSPYASRSIWALLTGIASLLPEDAPSLLPDALDGRAVVMIWAVCVALSLMLASGVAPGLPVLAAVAAFPRRPVVAAGLVVVLLALLPLQPDAVLAEALKGVSGARRARCIC